MPVESIVGAGGGIVLVVESFDIMVVESLTVVVVASSLQATNKPAIANIARTFFILFYLSVR